MADGKPHGGNMGKSMFKQGILSNRRAQVRRPMVGIGETEGSATGETEHLPISGGWSGTDDDTSTAPSDKMPKSPWSMEKAIEKVLSHVEEEAEEMDRKHWDSLAEQDERTFHRSP